MSLTTLFYAFPSGLGSLSGKKDVGVGIKAGNLYFGMEAAFSTETVKAFVDAFRAGSLEGREKAPAPEAPSSHGDEDGDDGTPSHVATLTNANFAEVVTTSSADLMMEFYAPWYGSEHRMQHM